MFGHGPCTYYVSMYIHQFRYVLRSVIDVRLNAPNELLKQCREVELKHFAQIAPGYTFSEQFGGVGSVLEGVSRRSVGHMFHKIWA